MPKTYPEDEPGHIEFIARGVAIDHRTGSPRVLLCRSRKRGYSYLPGGHVEFGETAAQALAREILEETGLSCQVGPLLQVHECAFHDGKVQRHEVNLLFHVKHLGPGGAPFPDPVPSAEPHIAFDWVPLDRVGSIDLRPARAGAWLTAHAAALAAGLLPPFESVADIDQ